MKASRMRSTPLNYNPPRPQNGNGRRLWVQEWRIPLSDGNGFQFRFEKEMLGVDYLSDERKKAQFDVEAMKVAWASSREALEIFDRIAKVLDSISVYNSRLIAMNHFQNKCNVDYAFINMGNLWIQHQLGMSMLCTGSWNDQCDGELAVIRHQIILRSGAKV